MSNHARLIGKTFFCRRILRLCLLLTLPAILVFTETASARTLLDMLMGRREIYREDTDRLIDDGRRIRPRPKNRATKPARRKVAPAGVQSGPAPAATVEPAIPAKLPDAKTVLVVGDFMASGLAEGLDAAFIDSPGVRIIDKADGSSGFVRDDHLNWPATVSRLIETENPSVVVVMAGANDRQQFTGVQSEAKGQSVLSEEWSKEYQARLGAFLEAVKKTGQPVVWVGQPAFKTKSMTNDLLAFNELYRNAAEKAEGTFVDVWDGFVDQSGSFTLTGFDMSGQTARLRNNDGIGLTVAGKRKLAFYVEKPLRQLLGTATAPDVAAIKPGAPVQALPETPSGPVKVDRLAPISLNDPELDGGTDLLGAPTRAIPATEKSARDLLVKQGVTPASQPGRTNDFSWPKPAK
ncbi:SGNH/GDSL hydrolase family protein [Phyllobacterium sp. K27]